ncbi:hypothetical protein [Xanthomonas arboricola]|uniref:hypothetical protein n=1 Tax=Xanthomonas arboricola TaxID=56448 RepID=UPI00141B8A44|nr:hypothetical protein [Xanthomonas arboricola]NIK44721.1 hypothetical protein [Xanthomonas arboricola]
MFIINPSISLLVAAERIDAALAVRLEPEMSGRFEEYPAFVGATSDLEIALLGPPQPEHDSRDNPTQDYALQVAPLAQVQPRRYSELHQQLLAGGVEVVAYELPPNNSFKPNPLRGSA